jgi:hypothetical protein
MVRRARQLRRRLARTGGPLSRDCDIVATIQAEQGENIRLDYPEVLMIERAPDTGKTVLALHPVILSGVLSRLASERRCWHQAASVPPRRGAHVSLTGLLKATQRRSHMGNWGMDS